MLIVDAYSMYLVFFVVATFLFAYFSVSNGWNMEHLIPVSVDFCVIVLFLTARKSDIKLLHSC